MTLRFPMLLLVSTLAAPACAGDSSSDQPGDPAPVELENSAGKSDTAIVTIDLTEKEPTQTLTLECEESDGCDISLNVYLNSTSEKGTPETVIHATVTGEGKSHTFEYDNGRARTPRGIMAQPPGTYTVELTKAETVSAISFDLVALWTQADTSLSDLEDFNAYCAFEGPTCPSEQTSCVAHFGDAEPHSEGHCLVSCFQFGTARCEAATSGPVECRYHLTYDDPYCVVPCQTDGDCGTGERCHTGEAFADPYCVPE